MLTRKSRKEVATSPGDVMKSPKSRTENFSSPKDQSVRTKKSVTPRRKSKSVEKNIRTRSRSSRRNLSSVNPIVSLERLSVEKKSTEKSKKEPKSNF